MWFNKNDLTIKPIISVDNLHGYVLPHAGTAYTGEIISHTLRFRPTKKINKIIILYYPATEMPDITDDGVSYYHEYYVPWKSLEYIFNPTGTTDDTDDTDDTNTPLITFEGYNIADLYLTDLYTNKFYIDTNKLKDIKKSCNLLDTLIVVSSDFSHFLPFNNAIELENKAAHALMFRELNNSPYIKIVDDVKTYKILYKLIPKRLQLQWIGRARSPGAEGVGYLSFLLKDTSITSHSQLPDGMFVTAFDKKMNSRECLGEWFQNQNTWTLTTENELINKVLYLARTTSRLTGGMNLDIPVSNYTVTYLYRDTKNNFIRGYHGMLHNAFYLPEVFLENTFNNGHWINENDKEWQSDNIFNLNETFEKLNIKAGLRFNTNTNNTNNTKRTKKNTQHNINKKHKYSAKQYTIYNSNVIHYKV